jgi:uncharacterized protein YbjQ (UPF0145 family)
MTREGGGGLGLPFTSAPDVSGFAALRTLGFDPVGRVAGTAVFRPARSFAACSRRARLTPVVDEAVEQFERQARRLAFDRMRRQCTAAGGHGVVGVGLTIRPFLGDTLEYVASGTAVRAGTARPARKTQPFTAGVGAADLVKLLRAGWMPVALVSGVAVRVVHDVSSDLELATLNNVELSLPTNLVRAARRAARAALAAEAARVGGHTVILDDIGLTVEDQPCYIGGSGGDVESEDRLVRAAMTGTAIVALHRPIGATAGRPLAIMRLDRDRRAAANWRNLP